MFVQRSCADSIWRYENAKSTRKAALSCTFRFPPISRQWPVHHSRFAKTLPFRVWSSSLSLGGHPCVVPCLPHARRPWGSRIGCTCWVASPPSMSWNLGTVASWIGTRRCGWSWKWSDFPYNTGIYYNILGMRRSDKKYRWRVAFNSIWSFSESQGIGLHGVLHFASLPRKGRLAAAATCGMVHCCVRSVAECYGDTWRCCCSFISGAHQDGSYFPIANKDRGLFTGSILDVFLLVLSWSWLFT